MISKLSTIKRRSVRKYKTPLLAERTVNEVWEFIATAPTQFNGKFGFKILDKNECGPNPEGTFGVTAPHYLMFFGNKDDDNVLRNIGIAGETVALNLAERGVGSCWLEDVRIKDTLNGSEYIISMAFGMPAEPLRTNEKETKRKPLEKIASGYTEEQKEILRYVRLAPSARNLQPWFFKCEENVVHIFIKKGMMSKLAASDMLQKIDIGIAIAHFALAPFTIEDRPQNEKGMQYECTLIF